MIGLAACHGFSGNRRERGAALHQVAGWKVRSSPRASPVLGTAVVSVMWHALFRDERVHEIEELHKTGTFHFALTKIKSQKNQISVSLVFEVVRFY